MRREQLGEAQAHVAAAAGVSQSTWSKIERGESALTVEQLNRAAAVLGTSPGDLLAQADDVAARLEAQGYSVLPARTDSPVSPTFVLISSVALAALVVALLKK